MIKDFNKIVKLMSKKWWNVVFKNDIFEIIDPECKQQYKSSVDKLIYRLKSAWCIISIKAGVYIIPTDQDNALNSVDLIEKYYIKLLKKYIASEVGADYYISWLKALQFHMKDFSIPERIYIVTKNTNKKIKLGSSEIIFKTISGRFKWKKHNLFTNFSAYRKNFEIEGIVFKISSLELSLLESALVFDTQEWINISILVRVIKKYSKVLREEDFREIGKYKYNMSFNRLKEIAKPIDSILYNIFLDIIKQNGWCFVWEWLRAM